MSVVLAFKKLRQGRKVARNSRPFWVTSSSHFGHLVKLFESKQIGPEDVAQL